MSDIVLTANQIIMDRASQDSYRVLWISAAREEAYWINMTGKRQIPLPLSLPAVEEALQNGRYAVVMDSAAFRDVTPGATAIKRRDEAWNLISSIVEQEPDIYRLHERSRLLKELSDRSGARVPNLYKLLRRYWTGGMTPNALLPRYEKCGGGSDPYSENNRRRGRKKIPGSEGKKLTPEDIQHFTNAILTWYSGTEKLTLEQTYKNMLGAFYVSRDEHGNAVSLDPDMVPSRSQFLYWHSQNKNILEERKQREGARNYPLQSRASIEKTETFLSGPCASSQIDATIADIFLVSQSDRTKIVGRPTMYFLMDSFTHIVTGMHITLDSPSWNSAVMCIVNAAEDKVGFCARYGVRITEEEWPCRHLPNAIVGDRGEMESVAADMLVNKLHIRIENTPHFRGDLKGIIEKYFHTIQVDMANLPGKMGKDYGERCTEDYRLDAKLTLNEFIAIIIHLVLKYNNYHYMKFYGKTMQMHQMGIKPIPRDLWNFGMKYLSGAQRSVSKAMVRYALLPTGQASITDHGIQFGGLYYGCDQGFREHWFDSAKVAGRESITVTYDPRDGSSIYFKPSPGQEPVECYLLNSNKLMGQFSTEELKQLREAERVEMETYQPTEDLENIRTNEKIQEIVDRALAAFPAKVEMSKHQRVSSIKDNREEEIKAEYQRSIKTATEVPPDSQPLNTKDSEPEIDPIQKMLDDVLDEMY